MSIVDPLQPTAADWLARNLDQPDLVVQGVPTSAGSRSGSDAWQAPAAVRRLLRRFSTFDSDNAVDLEDLRGADWGDWLVSHLDAFDAARLLRRSAEALPTRPVYAFVGGDGSLTHPVLASLTHAPIERFGLLALDAHHDVQDDAEARPTNDNQLRRLIDDGLAPDHVVQIGVHGFGNSVVDRTWCEGRGVRIATRRMVEQHGIDRVVEEALAYLEPEVDVIYVSCDLAVLDRAQAPGCPGSRPGGLSVRELSAAMVRAGTHPRSWRRTSSRSTPSATWPRPR